MKKKLAALFLALGLTLSLTACGRGDRPEANQDVDLAAFYETLASREDWPAMMPAEAEALDTIYPGLSEIETKQCVVNVAAISSVAGEIALVEASDSKDVDALKEIFQARIDAQVGDGTSPGGAWYPETIRQWQENALIVENGACVMLIVHEASSEIAESFNALF